MEIIIKFLIEFIGFLILLIGGVVLVCILSFATGYFYNAGKLSSEKDYFEKKYKELLNELKNNKNN